MAYSEYFGFTEAEVDQVLTDADCMDKKADIKRWYDGYKFGNKELYCPWDVVNCVDDFYYEYDMQMKCYWKNTSHNAIIRRFIDRADINIGNKLESLMNGKQIRVRILEDLSYDVLHSSEDNMWSILYMTGYLTMAKNSSVSQAGEVDLVIPNLEVKTIYEDAILNWFRDRMIAADRNELFEAFWNGNDKRATELVSDLLFDTISYYDYKEDYYHAFITGLFVSSRFDVTSNKEQGLGRPDLVIKDRK